MSEVITDADYAEAIRDAVANMNKMLLEARERRLSVQITMTTLAGYTCPTFRLDSVYKRVDEPLILRL